MTTPSTPQAYPLSIIANGCFHIHPNHGFATFNAAPRESLGLCTYFDTATYTIVSDADLEAIRTQRMLVSKSKLHSLSFQIRILQGPDSKEKLQEDVSEEESKYEAMIQSARQTGQSKQFTLFHTHKGQCAFDIDFDTAASIIAFAQQGKIVEIVHGSGGAAGADGLRPDIRVTAPTLPIRRNLNIAKPRLKA